MSVSAVPYALQNASHPANLFRIATGAPFASGGILASNELPVSQQSSPNMSIVLGPGRASIFGNSVSSPAGQGWNTQGPYVAYNDSNLTLTIAASDPTNPRIDAVYIQIQDSYYAGSANTAVAAAATGTPAVSPVAPAIPANSILIAYVAVAANATTIVTANISYQAVVAQLIATTSPSQGLTRVIPTSYSFSSTGVAIGPGGVVTMASATNVVLQGAFTAAYENYLMVINVDGMTTAGQLALQLAAAATVSAGTNYDSTTSYEASSTAAAPVTTSGTSNWNITPGSLGSHTIWIELQNPARAALTRGYVRSNDYGGAGAPVVGMTAIGHRALAAYDGIQLSLLSGAGMSGTIRIYGYNNN